MLILALDSCGPSCAACVWQDGRVLAQEMESMERGQDARLLPMAVAAMEKSGYAFSALDRIAVTRGPGSFTGVRVGLAAARGLGIAAGKPVIGIDRFALYRSLRQTADRNLLVVIDSKRAELFCQFFPAPGAAHDACLMTEDAISAFALSCPGTDIVRESSAPSARVPAVCAELAAGAEARNPDFLPRPFYLRAPDVTMVKSRTVPEDPGQSGGHIFSS